MQDKLAAANSSTKLQGGRMQTKEPSTTQGSPAALLRSASPRARLILITMLVALAACLYYVTEPIRWKFVPELKQTAVDDRGGVQTVSEDVKDTVTAAIIQEKNAAEGAKPTEIPTAVEQEDRVEEETAEEIASVEETAEGGDAEEEAQAEAAEEQQEQEESQAAADVEEGQEGQEQATTEEEQEGQESQDASEGASVVTVDEPSATDMLAPGEEPASHEEQEQVQEQQDYPNEDMSSSAESPEEVAGTNDGESVAGDEVVTADVSPEDSAEAMLSPSEAPTDVEQVAEDAESTNVEVAVTNAGEELSEAAHDAKSSLNAIDEATESASKLAEDASSEDVQNIAESVSATSGEVARVASEVLKATEEAKSTLQDVASGMATGDEENVEEDADKLEEAAEKLQDAAIVAEDAADQAQQAATEAEKVAQLAEDDGDSTKMLEAEQAKEVATTAQAEAEAIAEAAGKEASALRSASTKLNAKKKGKRRGTRRFLASNENTRRKVSKPKEPRTTGMPKTLSPSTASWVSMLPDQTALASASSSASSSSTSPSSSRLSASQKAMLEPCLVQLHRAQHRFLANAPAERLTWLGVKKHTEQVALAVALGALTPSLSSDSSSPALWLVDAGGNVGQTLRFFGGAAREVARRAPSKMRSTRGARIRMFSYEAHPDTFMALQGVRDEVLAALEDDGVKAQVTLKQAAVSSKSGGEVTIFTDGSKNDQGASKYGGSGGGGGGSRAKKNKNKSFRVPTISLDSDLIKSGAMDSKGRNLKDAMILVKLDIEGMESEAIEGMAKGLSAFAYSALVFEYDAARAKGSPSIPSVRALVQRLSAFQYRCYVASAARSFLNANVPDAWPDFDAGSGPAGVGKAVNLMCVPYGGVVDRHVVDSLLLCTPGCGSCYGDNESGGGGGGGGGGGARLNFNRGGNSKAWNTFGARDGVDEREAQTDMRVDLRARGWPIST